MKRMLTQPARYLLMAVICLGMLPVLGCGSRLEEAEALAIAMPSVEEAQAEAAMAEGVEIPAAQGGTAETEGAEDAEDDGQMGETLVEIVVTPSPTPVPTPTPAPTPSLPEIEDTDPIKGYTNASGVNMRAEPTTKSQVLDTLDKAVSLSITGKGEEWYRVKVDGETGYISRQFVGQGDVPALLTIERVKRRNGATNASGVNMREEPTTKSGVIEELDIFTHFTITGENEKWYQVEYGGQVGYVSKDYSEYAQGYYSSEDLYLVAQLVHQEARNTTLEGKVAVANVVYNRVRSSRFPNTIEGVVFQDGQFSPAESESSLRRVRPNSNAVKSVLEVFVRGETILPSGVLYFRAASLGTSWTSARTYYETFGGNCFFR